MPFAKVNGIRLHYAEYPKGEEAIFFLHSNIASARWWHPVLEKLPLKYRGIALDLRGAGLSDKPNVGHTTDQFAHDVIALADHLNIEKFHVVGHSYGGLIALKTALDAPKRLKSLLLMNPAPANGLHFPQPVHEMMKVWKEDWQQLAELLASANPKTDHTTFYWQQIMDESFVASDATFLTNMVEMGKYDYSDRLHEVTCKTLITCSPHDLWIPIDDINKMLAKLPNAKKLEIQNVGHTPALEVPELFLQAALEFWQN